MIQNTGHCRSQTTAAAENGGVVTVVHSFAVMLVVSFIPFLANADGGVVRLQERQGPFTITIFTPTVIPGGLPTDITVMVQRRDSCEVVMDADVELEIAPVGTSVNV